MEDGFVLGLVVGPTAQAACVLTDQLLVLVDDQCTRSKAHLLLALAS